MTKSCSNCGKLFTARRQDAVSCSPDCRRAYRVARNRWKHSRRRAARRITDISPQQEAGMRRRARKCPLCGVFMTGRPRLPNSKELDHIVPVGVGGTHTHGNVRIICRTCNLKRPKDGSDFTGQLTLWAAAPGVSVVTKTTRPAGPPRPLRLCACGDEFRPQNAKAFRCHACVVKLGQDAAALRKAGMRWEDVATALAYPSAGNLHTYAVKYGGYQGLFPRGGGRVTVMGKSFWWLGA